MVIPGLGCFSLNLKSNLACVCAQLYPTLCNSMDCSPPGSSVQGISQARILSGLPFPSSRDLPDAGIKSTSVLHLLHWQVDSLPLSYLGSPKATLQKYITIHKVGSQREFAVWLSKHKQGLCINLEGWDGAGDGREVQKGGDICIPMADSC